MTQETKHPVSAWKAQRGLPTEGSRSVAHKCNALWNLWVSRRS